MKFAQKKHSVKVFSNNMVMLNSFNKEMRITRNNIDLQIFPKSTGNVYHKKVEVTFLAFFTFGARTYGYIQCFSLSVLPFLLLVSHLCFM